MSRFLKTVRGPFARALGDAVKKDSVESTDPVTIFDGRIPTYDGSSFSVSGEMTNPMSVRFSADGGSMFVVGRSAVVIFQYTLSIPWEVASASYSGLSFSFSGQTSQPRGVTFKADGTSMYMIDTRDDVFQYALSTAWDISTAVYSGNSVSVSAQATNPYGLDIGDNGENMTFANNSTGLVYQYSLATPWDISTASYSGNFLVPPAEATSIYGTKYDPTGGRFYIVSLDLKSIYIYSLGTPWDISAFTLIGTINVRHQESYPHGVTFRPDGTQMYMVGISTDTVYQYTVGGQQ